MTKHHARLTHPHTGQPIVPLGYRRNGAPIWPILGASEDDGADTADDQGDATDESDDVDDAAGDDTPDPDGADQLGDAGKKALDRMKADLREERRQKRELQRQLDEARKPATDENTPPDPEALKEEGRREARLEADKRIIRAETKAAATGKLADPSDALTFIDLTQFEVDSDGNVDPEEIADAIDELLKQKPYLAAQGGKRFQGGADGGNRNGTKPPTLDEQIASAQAEGRVRDVIALNNRRLAEVAGKS